jgi:transposase
MKATRRKFTSGFKAQAAIETLKERDTLAVLSKRYEVHPAVLTKWKQQVVDRSSELFETEPPEVNFDEERQRLFAKIGQLEMERDWLKKISKTTGR